MQAPLSGANAPNQFSLMYLANSLLMQARRILFADMHVDVPHKCMTNAHADDECDEHLSLEHIASKDAM